MDWKWKCAWKILTREKWTADIQCLYCQMTDSDCVVLCFSGAWNLLSVIFFVCLQREEENVCVWHGFRTETLMGGCEWIASFVWHTLVSLTYSYDNTWEIINGRNDANHTNRCSNAHLLFHTRAVDVIDIGCDGWTAQSQPVQIMCGLCRHACLLLAHSH